MSREFNLYLKVDIKYHQVKEKEQKELKAKIENNRVSLSYTNYRK